MNNNIPILSSRLKMCADMVRPNVSVADIGTDHGLLPIFLVNSGKCFSAVASDIREGPLGAAKKNLSYFKADDSIRLNLGCGTDGISSEECDDIVIAGMGGETIAEILNNCKFGKEQNKRFVLQPMTSVSDLRMYLFAHGYEILDENIAVENKKYYVVMSVRYCGKNSDFDQFKCEIGMLKLRINEDNVRSYLEFLSEKYLKIAEKIEKETNNYVNNSYKEISIKIKELLRENKNGQNW